MATYPTGIGQLLTSVEVWDDDLKVERSVNGTAKGRAFYTSRKLRVTMRHTVNATDLGTLKTFYDANRATTFTLIWGGDGNSYTCMFAGPMKIGYVSPSLSTFEVVIAQQ